MSAARRRIAVFMLFMVKWAVYVVPAWACPVCFRMEEGPVTDGVFAAVLVLLGVTSAVLGGFAVFIHGFVRRLRAVGVSASQGRASTTESE